MLSSGLTRKSSSAYRSYTDWRGQHVFLDTKLDVGYGNLDGQRSLIIGDQDRVADGKRASLLASLGGTTGLFFNVGGLQLDPHVSLDGLTMREEGYTEDGGGSSAGPRLKD